MTDQLPAPTSTAVDTARLRAALDAAAGWYRARLLVDRPPAAVGLLRDRGLADLAVDTPVGLRWRVGHAPGSPGRAGLVGYLRGRGFTEEEMVAAGLATPARPDSGAGGAGRGRWGSGVVDVLRHRLMVPLVEPGGVVGFTARRLVDGGSTAPKWVNTATTALHRKSEHLIGLAQQAERIAAGRGRVVLVEGAVDAIAVDLAGDIGLAAGGTRLTEAHAVLLRAAAAATGGRLLVAYDGDQAGREATMRAAGLLAGVDVHAVRLPDGQDPAAVLGAAGPRGLRRALPGPAGPAGPAQVTGCGSAPDSSSTPTGPGPRRCPHDSSPTAADRPAATAPQGSDSAPTPPGVAAGSAHPPHAATGTPASCPPRQPHRPPCASTHPGSTPPTGPDQQAVLLQTARNTSQQGRCDDYLNPRGLVWDGGRLMAYTRETSPSAGAWQRPPYRL